MYPPTERLQHLDVPRRTAPIIPIVPRIARLLALRLRRMRDDDAPRNGRDNVRDVKVEDARVDVGRGVRGGLGVQERGEGLHGDDGRGEAGEGGEGVFVGAAHGRASRVSPVQRTHRSDGPSIDVPGVSSSLGCPRHSSRVSPIRPPPSTHHAQEPTMKRLNLCQEPLEPAPLEAQRRELGKRAAVVDSAVPCELGALDEGYVSAGVGSACASRSMARQGSAGGAARPADAGAVGMTLRPG